MFGFPPQKAYIVLNRFRTYGDFRHEAGDGNWIHLRYSDPIKAELALADNGLTIDNEFMIGVKAREDRKEHAFASARSSTNEPASVIQPGAKRGIEADLEMLKMEGGVVGGLVQGLASLLLGLGLLKGPKRTATKVSTATTRKTKGRTSKGLKRKGFCEQLTNVLFNW